MSVRRIDDTHYEVDSHTTKGTTYTVTLYPSGATCPCKGFGYRRECSHTKEVFTALKANTPLDELVATHDALTSPTAPQMPRCANCDAPLSATHATLGVCPACLRREALHP